MTFRNARASPSWRSRASRRVNSLFTLWGGDIADLLGRTGIEPGVQDVVLTMGVVMLVLAEYAHAALGEDPGQPLGLAWSTPMI